MRALLRAALALAAVLAAAAAHATCRTLDHAGESFTACPVDPATADLRLWLRDPDGRILGTFDRVDALVAEDGGRLAFAMNAGMYHEDRRPVGLYVEEGVEIAPLVTRAGPGNFGMLPNGVLCLGRGTAAVIESRRFAESRPPCRFATQSGPMLVIDGALHPRFLPDSTSRHVRNGAGIAPDGTLWLAISDRPVTFHVFARFFRDALGTPDALYLDGSVSRLFAPAAGRHDVGLPFGPVIGLVDPAD